MSKLRQHMLSVGAAVCGLTTGVPMAAHAADQTVADAGTAIGELVVTARRREERLQEVPVAVTAASGEQLEARSIRSLQEVSTFTPNLRFAESSRGGSIATVTMRGLTNVNQTIANDPAVGIYFDEVYMARSSGPMIVGLQDMQSVQVLRGNQGTLFGRNNTGGAIVMTPNRPNLNEIEGNARVGFGNYNRQEYAGVLSVPIVEDKLAIRGVFMYQTRDGIGKSYTTGIDDFGDRDRLNTRISVRFAPIDDLTFDLTYDYSKIDEAGTTTRRLETPLPPGASFYDSLVNTVPATKFDTEGVTFRAEWGLTDDTTLKVISGYRHLTFEDQRDIDGSPAAQIDTYLGGNQNQFSTEVQLAGSATPGGSLPPFDYVMGVYYFNEQGLNTSQIPWFSTPFLQGRTSPSTAENSSVAAYGQVEAHFTDQTSAWLGLRYTKDERELEVRGFLNGNCSLTGSPPGCRLEGNVGQSYASWSVGVRHKFTDDINAYVRIGRGQRAGGLDDTPTAVTSFEPEELTDYELGLKADLLNRTLRTNLALFWSDYKNMQLTTLLIDAANVPYTSVFNAATATIRGAELEVTYNPIRPLLLQATVGYVDAQYDEFVDPRPGPTRGQDASGNRFTGVPEWTYAVSGEYTFDLGGSGELVARADYSWQDGVAGDTFGNRALDLPSFGLVNARLTYRPDVQFGRFTPEVALWGKNLTDEELNNSLLASGVGTTAFRSDNPRTYGIDISARF